MKRLAIIPARGGSKRIPRKNIRSFLGHPIIYYSIESALKSKLFDEVMVSTDDNEIAEISKSLGASIPFMRTPKNANDYAILADVIEEVLEGYYNKGENFEQYCCILPTAPLLKSIKIKEAFDLLDEKGYQTVFPVLRFSYPIQRALKMDEKKNVTMLYPENLAIRSQDLPPSFHDAGQFYCGNVAEFKKDKRLFTDNSGSIELTELEVQDIDNEVDWKLAELKYSLIHK